MRWFWWAVGKKQKVRFKAVKIMIKDADYQSLNKKKRISQVQLIGVC
jgi:hypothetical protein